MGSADGQMYSPFLIIKNSMTKADQSKSTVLDRNHMMKNAGFGASRGWVYKTWSKAITLPNKRTEVPTTQTYVRNYFFNTVTKAVITANSKAWMDAVTLGMWVEVQIKELFGGTKKLLVVDNCPSHTVEAVKAVFAENNIILKFLPKNMTDRLQPMDLVVNGPLKASIKSARGLSL
jgi:hypothetical protein